MFIMMYFFILLYTGLSRSIRNWETIRNTKKKKKIVNCKRIYSFNINQ